MLGKDRVPTISGGNPVYLNRTDVLGWQGQLFWTFDARNQLGVRFEYFDPDTDSANDGTRGLGLAYIYYINPGVRLTAAYEMFDEEGAEKRNKT